MENVEYNFPKTQDPSVTSSDTQIIYRNNLDVNSLDDLVILSKNSVITDNSILTGQVSLPRGSVLGKEIISGKHRLCVSTAVDGSEIPDAILVDQSSTEFGDVEIGVYLKGNFRKEYISHDSSWTTHPFKLSDLFSGLKACGLILE